MKLTIAPNGNLQIDDARLTYMNFEGRKDQFNRNGDRSFAVIIPNQEIADILLSDENQYGKSWNVHIKPPKEEGDNVFIYLPVKVKFGRKPPRIYLRSGAARTVLTESNVGILDTTDIDHVDLDIRPYDGDGAGLGGPFRAAYLDSMEVFQNVDRFEARYAAEEHPEE